MITLREFSNQKKVFLVAHRGSSEKYFENTIEAYIDALNSNVKMIEVDLQVTKDKKVIACHNGEIHNLNVENISQISQFNYQEIRKVIAENTSEISTNKENKIFLLNDETTFDKNLFHLITLPLLSEVIETINDKAYLIVEIKSNFTENDIEKAEIILNEIQKCNYLDKTLFASFDINILKKLKELNSESHIAVIKNPYKELTPSDYLKILNFDAFICSVDEINDKISNETQANNLFLGIYSTDTLEQLELVKKHKANAIVTNYPARTLELIKEHNIFELDDLLL